MAQNRTAEEKEYQDAIKYTSSIIGDMKRAIEATAEASDLRNKKIFEEISLTKKVINSLKDEKSYDEALIKLAEQKKGVLQTNFGVNEKMKNIYLAQLDAAGAIVEKEQARLKIVNETQRISDNLQNKFTSSLNNIGEKIKGIPIIGDTLFQRFWTPFQDKASGAIDSVKKRFMTQFKTGFTQATNKGMSMMDSFSSGLTRGLGSAKNMIVGLLGPQGLLILGVVAGIAAIALMFKAGLDRFKELDTAAKRFREETGLLNSQTKQMQSNIKAVSTEFAGLGVTADEVASAAAAFANELKPSEQVSKETLSSMVALNKNFGIGVNEGAELNKIFQNIGGLTQEQSQLLIGQTAQMAKLAGVAPSRVIQDMAESSEYAYRYFNGSPQALAKAAVQAAKLGTSIGQAGKVADGLLDFQSSITSELEASALLGTNINLGQARYLAANGKVLESQQAVLDEVAGIGDLTKLNTFEQDALTKATGMQMDDLINQQRIREQFGKLEGEQLAAATSLLETGKDISKMNASDLDAQTKKLASQKEMQSQMDNLSNSIGAIGTGFTDALAPVAAYLIPVFTDLIDMAGSILLPLLKGIGSAFRIVFGQLSIVMNLFMTILKPIVAVAGAILEGLMTPINMVADELDPLFAKFAELKDKVMQAVTPILPIFTFLGKLIGTVVAGAVGMFVDVLIKGFDILFGVIETISNFIVTYIVNPIMSIITAIQGVFTSVKSFIGLGDDSPASNNASSPLASTAPAINDGVVQDGKVVSTNPADTIFAMKKPEDLAKSGTTIQQSPTIDISSLVNKMDEMIAAVSANRDVYMDREKVSSAVVTSSEKSSQNRFGLMGA